MVVQGLCSAHKASLLATAMIHIPILVFLSFSHYHNMASTKLRVAIIGAGAAGLCAARHILSSPDTFAPPVVFEASAHLGGIWVYSEETGEDAESQPSHSSMYRDLR